MTFIELTPDQLREMITSAVRQELAKQSQIEPEQLLSRKEAAELLKISLPTLSAWEREKIIHPQRKGKRVYFLKSDLLKK